MKTSHEQNREDSGHGTRWSWIIAGCLVVVLIAVLLPRLQQDAPAPSVNTHTASNSAADSHSTAAAHASRLTRPTNPVPDVPAAEIVARKLSQFAQNRLEIVRAMARQRNIEVPAEIERFFELVKSGGWDELLKAFEELNNKRMRQGGGWSEEVMRLWPAVLETYGVAEVTHDWPAQRLLDYGEAVLGSLRPGMVYVGGTDPGRFIPTLLNETSDGERHIVLTQNALADGTYLEYLRFLYSDRLATLTSEDSQNCFKQYSEDAQRRFLHDQQFPNEPKQLRHGEGIQMNEGRVQVSGQVSVMAINELVMQTLLQKNPDLAFALEESFPFKSTYASAAPLGSLMELRVRDGESALTPERAVQSVDYWRTTIQPLLSDPETPAASEPRQAYAKLILGQANLFLDRNFTGEAEQAYRLAIELCPSSPEAVFNYVTLLIKQGRVAEARQVAQTATSLTPNNQQFQQLLEALNRTH